MEEVITDTTPCRVAYKRYSLSLAKRCLAEIRRLLRLKEKQRRMGGRLSLHPKILQKRISALTSASQQALNCAALCLREELDENNKRHWIMSSMPPLEASRLLPRQSQHDLEALGTYSSTPLPPWIRNKNRRFNEK